MTDAQATMGLGIEVATKNHLSTVEGGIELIDVRTVTAAGDMMLVLKLLVQPLLDVGRMLI